MPCPKCNYEGVTSADCFCSKCGQLLESATHLDIRQDVKKNLGWVVGVQTGAIHGNVYGGDIYQYQVQLYVLSGTDRAANWAGFLNAKTPPYKYLSPYTACDQALFKGRQAETEQVVRQIGEQSVLVVHGQVGVGKTSLMAAGVIPILIENGALAVHLRDYTQPLEKSIRQALAASANQIRIPLPAELKLPALLRTICETTQGTLVLVLDQVERLFEPAVAAEQRAATLEGLAQTLQTVKPELFRLVLVIRSGDLARLGEFQDHLPGLWRMPFLLPSFSRRQAQLAIEEPLVTLHYLGGVSYIDNLVSCRLVPDLDALTPQEPGRIMPAHLQIVCYWLYQDARAALPAHPPHIGEALYRRAKGAEGIMASYVERTLTTEFGSQQVLAKRLMEALASPTVGPWASPERLPLNGASPEQGCSLLDRLVEAKLLLYRNLNGQREYAFASPCVEQEIRLRASPERQKRYQAEGDLERIWSAWLAHESLAGRTGLRYLEQECAYLSPPAIKLLLLLRSAAALDIPGQPWPAQLRATDQGSALIQELEEPESANLAWHNAPSTLEEARRLLGLNDSGLTVRPDETDEAFGPVAWSAVSHPQPAIRQAAALALTALEPYPRTVLSRLNGALRAGPAGQRRWQQRVELWGLLADADPHNKKLRSHLSDLSLVGQIGVWGWQAKRRLNHDLPRIAGLMIGGGIGAGLGLGLLRGGLGALAGRMVGIQFAMYFWWAWLLGAALALGMALAEPLLGRSGQNSEIPPIWRAPLHPDRLPATLATGLGALFFGLAHMIVAWFNGLSLAEVPLMAPLGFVAGLGLSLALYNQPKSGWPQKAGRWLFRLGIAVLTFILTQTIFMLAGNQAPGLAVAWGNSFYEAHFSQYWVVWWQELIHFFPHWFDYMALCDAGLVGLTLAVGLTAGLILATDWLARWRNLINQANQ